MTVSSSELLSLNYFIMDDKTEIIKRHLSLSHYINANEITSFQKKCIDEVRVKLKDTLKLYPDYDTDFSILRWIMGYDYDINVIVPKMKVSIETLVALDIKNIKLEVPEDINEHIVKYSPAAQFFPGGIMGLDKNGNAIIIQPLAKAIPKLLVKTEKASLLHHLSIVEIEMAFTLIREEEKKRNTKLGAMIIMDLDGFSTELLYMPAVRIYLSLLSLLQDLFPDFARSLYIINCPKIIGQLLMLVRPVLAKQTREKIKILGDNWKDVLREELGEEYLYPQWGGNKKICDKYEKINIRPGGVPPDNLLFTEERLNNNFNLKNLDKINIPAGSIKKITVRANKGQQLLWYFTCPKDIDFKVLLKGITQWPNFRISTEFVPEFGNFTARESGEYEFIFDNSYGTFFSKNVYYIIYAK
uniref:CRAL-TRIO domain-containing protein n=1 Tax=Strongyloides papillosus TaxID=174720 RepID=A0A0N5C2I2_STREA